MDSFPENFNLKAVGAELLENIAKKQLPMARQYIYDRFVVSKDEDHEYFTLDLSKYSETVKKLLLEELIKLFPDIGYKNETPEGSDALEHLFTNVLLSAGQDKKPRFKIFRFKNCVDPKHNHYVVAKTGAFGVSMEKYSW